MDNLEWYKEVEKVKERLKKFVPDSKRIELFIGFRIKSALGDYIYEEKPSRAKRIAEVEDYIEEVLHGEDCDNNGRS